MIAIIKSHTKDLLILLMVILSVSYLQIVLLGPHLSYGFTPDDWWPLAHFHVLDNLGLFPKIIAIWKTDGAYTTYQVLYISLLHHFFGLNFEAYQITNHVLKAISAISIYPLVAVIFNNRKLAFLTSMLYAMAYSPAGTLEIVAKGSDFISISFMAGFLICYYYLYRSIKKGWIWEISASILLLLTIFFCPIRMYPLLGFIILAEIYGLSSKILKPTVALRRILVLFIPYLVVLALAPLSILSFLLLDAPSRTIAGNWHLLLHPLGSFGSLFLLNDYWRIFGVVQINTFPIFLTYLLTNTLIIFLLFSVFFAFILEVPRKQLLGFFVKILLTNILIQGIAYLLVKHIEQIPSAIRVNYDSLELLPVFLAIFILIISYYAYKKWTNSKNNNLLLALWLGTIFSMISIMGTWALASYGVIFKGVHSYLNVPSIGSSLFISALIVLLYNKIRSLNFLGKAFAPFVFLVLVPIFFINKNILDFYWINSNYSMNANEQQKLRDNLMDSLGSFDNNRFTLFYFGTLKDLPNGRFYEQTLLGRFGEWLFVQGKFPPNRCLTPVFIIDRLELLQKAAMIKDGEKGFLYHDYCYTPHFYPLKDFYAFELIDKKPVNIKDSIFNQMDYNNKNSNEQK